MNTRKKLRKVAPLYRRIEKDDLLRWLNRNYVNRAKDGLLLNSPLPEYKYIVDTIRSFQVMRFVLGIVGLIPFVFSVWLLKRWADESVVQNKFMLEAPFFAPLGILIPGGLFLNLWVNQFMEAWIDARWKTARFAEDVKMLVSSGLFGSFERLRASGYEGEKGVVPEHVLEELENRLVTKAYLIKFDEEFISGKNLREYGIAGKKIALHQDKEFLKDLFNLCTRFSILPEGRDLRYYYAEADRKMKLGKENQSGRTVPA